MCRHRTVYAPPAVEHLTTRPAVPRHLHGVAPPIARRLPPVTSARLRVDINRAGEGWGPYRFRGYRWDNIPLLGRWRWYEDDYIRTGVMLLLRADGGIQHGYLIGPITPTNIQVVSIELSRPDARHPDTWQTRIRFQRNASHDWFGQEIYRHYLSVLMRTTQSLGILVAIGTGIAIGAGFGPCAAGIGLGGGLAPAANAIASGVASCLANFIHGNAQAMMQAVRDDPEHGAAHYWRAHTTDFESITTNSIISGAFSAGTTYYLPGPSSLSSPRDWSHLAVQRLGTHIANALQTLLTTVAGGNPASISEQQVREQIERETFRNAIVQLFN
jgi:hypothetical protein